MGIEHQRQFKRAGDAATVTNKGDDWAAAAHGLSGLAMFDILPALSGISATDRDRVVQTGLKVLSYGSYQRINYAKNVLKDRRLPTNDLNLPDDQVVDAQRFLIEQLKPASSSAGQARFRAADEAAIAAIAEINPTSQAVGVEFAGAIFKKGVLFGFTWPKQGDATGSDSYVSVPAGTTRVGTYHTHPDNNNNAENFSPQDIMIAQGVKTGEKVIRPPLLSYLGTPNGKIKKLTPPALLSAVDRNLFRLFGKQDVVR